VKRPKEDILQDWLNSVGGLGERRTAVGWTNSNDDALMWWLGAGRKRIKGGDKFRGRYVTEPWWCLPERRAKCVKKGLCLRGHCVGTRKEKFRKCRKVLLFQAWGFVG